MKLLIVLTTRLTKLLVNSFVFCMSMCYIFKVVCKYLAFDSTVSDYQLLQGVSQAAKVYYNYTGSSSCLNTSQTATGSLGFLGWFYQVR